MYTIAFLASVQGISCKLNYRTLADWELITVFTFIPVTKITSETSAQGTSREFIGGINY